MAVCLFVRWVHLCMCIVLAEGCFITKGLHEIVTACWQSHSGERLFHLPVEHLPPSCNVCLYYLMETHLGASQGHIVISCSVTRAIGTHRSLGHVGRGKDMSLAIIWKDRIIPISIWVNWFTWRNSEGHSEVTSYSQDSQFRHASIWLAEQKGGEGYLKAHILCRYHTWRRPDECTDNSKSSGLSVHTWVKI